jgi:hypothetical protein
VPLAAGLVAYLVVAAALLPVPMPPIVALASAAVALTVAIRVLAGRAGRAGSVVGSVGSAGSAGRTPARWRTATRWGRAWDVLARALVATALVLVLSAVAEALGPRLVGMVAPFPVYASVMASFAFASEGPAASLRLLRGVLVGAYGFACFYLVVAVLVRDAVVGAFVAATVTALSIQLCSMWAIRRLGW